MNSDTLDKFILRHLYYLKILAHLSEEDQIATQLPKKIFNTILQNKKALQFAQIDKKCMYVTTKYFIEFPNTFSINSNSYTISIMNKKDYLNNTYEKYNLIRTRSQVDCTINNAIKEHIYFPN